MLIIHVKELGDPINDIALLLFFHITFYIYGAFCLWCICFKGTFFIVWDNAIFHDVLFMLVAVTCEVQH